MQYEMLLPATENLLLISAFYWTNAPIHDARNEQEREQEQ